jgi:hypothetical protein
MATLNADTFPGDKQGKKVLDEVKQALRNLTGLNGGTNGAYLVAPVKLNADRDVLKPSYKQIWNLCTIVYDDDEKGAEMSKAHQITLGPLLLSMSVTDIEKIILHEYLHEAIDIGVNVEEMEHGQINHIIRDNLHYPGPPNPANPAED